MAMEKLKTPAVGLGITYAIGGDCYPYTIRQVSPSGHQFRADPDHVGDDLRTFTRRKDGTYMAQGAPYTFVYVGRKSSWDPSF